MSEVLKRYRKLQADIESAWEQYTHSTANRQKAEVERGQAKRALDQMHLRRPQSRATDKEVEAAEVRVNEAEDAYDDWYSRTCHALDAAKGLELERDQFIREHPEEVMEAAEAGTQAALRALGRAADAIRDAQEAWAKAEQAWVPFCRAHRQPPVEPWPFVQPEDLLSQVPRPRAVVLTS